VRRLRRGEKRRGYVQEAKSAEERTRKRGEERRTEAKEVRREEKRRGKEKRREGGEEVRRRRGDERKGEGKGEK
jgi:hypothetical protein